MVHITDPEKPGIVAAETLMELQTLEYSNS